MNLIKLICVISIASILSGCIVVAKASHVNHHQRKTLKLDASQLKRLDIDVGSGKLEVIGQAGLTEIIVKAGIYTHSKHKNDYELGLKERGERAELVAKMDSTSGFWVGDSPRIDVVVFVPETLMLDINDGSGNIKVSNIIANLDINDGSGEMVIENITGDVNIDDGSGDMILTKIIGAVNINDGSGNIFATDITGSATIEDGSGDLTVKKVTGVVTVDDGSGDIDVDQAGGLTILEQGSGGLRVNNVEGRLEIDS